MALDYYTSARYAIRALKGDNLISDLDAGLQALVDDVDAKFTGYMSGTHAARVAATALDGLLWRETDAPFLLYLGNGTTWLPIMAPGPWTALTLGTNITAYGLGHTPGVRQEGDIGRLCGEIVNNSGGNLTNYTWATLPSGFFPSKTEVHPAAIDNTGAGDTPTWVYINLTGTITVRATIAASQRICLDGITYRMV